mmetsp:Transcript_62970/g.144913  ORF Transcript_62970/g.144913 Transcript_62970/m.144913 type:complete len:341 (-) Transcript_62970:287-1309(-)
MFFHPCSSTSRSLAALQTEVLHVLPPMLLHLPLPPCARAGVVPHLPLPHRVTQPQVRGQPGGPQLRPPHHRRPAVGESGPGSGGGTARRGCRGRVQGRVGPRAPVVELGVHREAPVENEGYLALVGGEARPGRVFVEAELVEVGGARRVPLHNHLLSHPPHGAGNAGIPVDGQVLLGRHQRRGQTVGGHGMVRVESQEDVRTVTQGLLHQRLQPRGVLRPLGGAHVAVRTQRIQGRRPHQQRALEDHRRAPRGVLQEDPVCGGDHILVERRLQQALDREVPGAAGRRCLEGGEEGLGEGQGLYFIQGQGQAPGPLAGARFHHRPGEQPLTQWRKKVRAHR